MQLTAPQLSDLLVQVGRGDHAAFRALYQATSAKLYGIILRILQRRSVSDEILQEAYVRIWNNAAQYDPTRASPITWMATIARNRALDEVRRQTPQSLDAMPDALDIKDPQLLASEQMELAADQQALLRCLDALEPDRRELIKLAYLEGRSREDLGRQFGAPTATIKTWLHRSLKQLKTCLSS
jgi:RNA polymerase sigma-70 factor, ECF subfamily